MADSLLEFQRKLRWLLVSRFVLFVLILVAILILRPMGKLLLILFVLYGFGTLGYLLLPLTWKVTGKELSFRFVGGLSLTFELLVEGAVIHFSGGAASPLLMLFVLTIITSAFIYKLPGTLITATAAVLVYAGIVFAEFKGLADFKPAIGFAGDIYSHSSTLFLWVYIYSLFLYLIAFLSGYLSSKLKVQMGEFEMLMDKFAMLKMDTGEILGYMKSGIMTLSPDGIIIYFNRAAEEILELSASDIQGEPFDRVLPDGLSEFTAVVKKLISNFAMQSIRQDIHITQKDGSRIPVLISVSRLTVKGEFRGYVSVFEDITIERKRQDLLKELEKLAAVGELSAHLAHEIRNPLASIRGSIEMLVEDMSLSREDNRLFSLVMRESDRLTSILNDFLAFARIGEMPEHSFLHERVDIASLIDDVIELGKKHPSYHSGIEIINKLRSPVYVAGDDSTLKQVFTNLLVNACESIGSQSGEIVIENVGERRDIIDERSIVGIAVCDSGEGIDERHREEVFKPFFSKKGSGSGLGLAIANGIVSRHRGYIEVGDSPSGGACFVVYLPTYSGNIETKELLSSQYKETL